MDDPRLICCRHCQNQIMVVAGDNECHVCHEPLPKPCPLAEPERARFTSIAGAACLLIGQIGHDDVPATELRRGVLKSLLLLADAVGVSSREIFDAGLQLARSEDKQRWLTEMTQL